MRGVCSPLSAPPAHLERQLYEDDAPGQCPLQVVGGDRRASALKKGEMGSGGGRKPAGRKPLGSWLQAWGRNPGSRAQGQRHH